MAHVDENCDQFTRMYIYMHDRHVIHQLKTKGLFDISQSVEHTKLSCMVC